MSEIETITIPRQEYDRLVEAAEELADIAAYDAAMAERGEPVPHELVVRLVEGENPITVFREFRGMSKAGLARAAGVDRVQLLDIEAGRRRGSVDTLAKLAAALRVRVDDLI
jgi:DNA-binding XRE family transcriptional regulator